MRSNVKNSEEYIVGDYDEDNWLEDAIGWVIIGVASLVIFFVSLREKIFKHKKLKKKVACLTGNALKEGNFYCLEELPLNLLMENKDCIKNQLQLIFWTEPHLLIGLINLRTGIEEKNFLNGIMFEIFSFSKRNLTIAVSRILSSEMTMENKNIIVSYMTQYTEEGKRAYFIDFFRETFKKIGDPIKTSIESIIGEKL